MPSLRFLIPVSVIKYSLTVAGVIILISHICVSLRLKSLHKQKLDRIDSIDKVTKTKLDLINDSIVRYHKDYDRLAELTKKFRLSTNRQIRLIDSSVLDNKFSAFNKWSHIYPPLEAKKVNLNLQLYSDLHNDLVFNKAFNSRYASLNALTLVEVTLGIVYFIFWYILKQWNKEYAPKAVSKLKRMNSNQNNYKALLVVE